MLKFKTFNVIMLILQVVASGICEVWAIRSMEKSNVFFALSGVAACQIAYSLVG
jgi:hypothetical protein